MTDEIWTLEINKPFKTVDYLILSGYLSKLEPKGDKVMSMISTTNGYKILVKAFRTEAFEERYPEVKINKL